MENLIEYCRVINAWLKVDKRCTKAIECAEETIIRITKELDCIHKLQEKIEYFLHEPLISQELKDELQKVQDALLQMQEEEDNQSTTSDEKSNSIENEPLENYIEKPKKAKIFYRNSSSCSKCGGHNKENQKKTTNYLSSTKCQNSVNQTSNYRYRQNITQRRTSMKF